MLTIFLFPIFATICYMEENRYMYMNQEWHLARKRLLLKSRPLSMEEITTLELRNQQGGSWCQSSLQPEQRRSGMFFIQRWKKHQRQSVHTASPSLGVVTVITTVTTHKNREDLNPAVITPLLTNDNRSLYLHRPENTCQPNISIVSELTEDGQQKSDIVH